MIEKERVRSLLNQVDSMFTVAGRHQPSNEVVVFESEKYHEPSSPLAHGLLQAILSPIE